MATVTAGSVGTSILCGSGKISDHDVPDSMGRLTFESQIKGLLLKLEPLQKVLEWCHFDRREKSCKS
jgi:hypothetical protein